MKFKKKIAFSGMAMVVILGALMLGAGPGHSQEKAAIQPASGLRFEVSFPAGARSEPITGRIYAIISRDNKRELRFQTGFTGVPIWGQNIFAQKPGEPGIIDVESFGHPLKSIKDIPRGE